MRITLKKTTLAFLALIVANIIWGAAAPIFKWSLRDVEPFTFGFLRFFLAALFFLPFTIHRLHIRKEDLFTFGFLGLFGITVHISYLLLGLQISESINLPIITSAGPVFLIIGSMLFLREKPKRKTILGTLISLAGVIFIILQPLLEKGLDGSVWGNLFYVIATVCFVVYTIVLHKLTKKYHFITLTFWTFAIGALGFTPFMFSEIHTNGFLTGLETPGLFGILYGAIFSSGIAYACYAFGMKYIATNETGIFLYIDPVVAVIIAMPLLGEKVTLPFLLGSFLVFAGIFVAEKRIHYHPLHKLRS